MPNVAKMMEVVLNLGIEGRLNFLHETNVFPANFCSTPSPLLFSFPALFSQ